MRALVVGFLASVVACGGSSTLKCGRGTTERNGECVVAEQPGAAGGGGTGGIAGWGGAFESGGAGASFNSGGAGASFNSGGAGASFNSGGAGASFNSGGAGASFNSGGAGGTSGFGGSAGAGDGGASDEPSEPPGATPDEVEEAAELCELPEGGVVSTTNVDELVEYLAHRWLHCEGPIVFGRDDTAGLRFERDGTWKFLIEGDGGELVDGQGFDDTGTWVVVDNTQFQINMVLSGGGGSNPAFFAFATEPAKMRLTWFNGGTDYAALGD